ncbi:MAG: ABC transporter permease [Bacteroidota bacterium]
MLKNHLLLILRNAWRYRGYTLINTVGLAVGVACCLVIALFVHDEWTTDQFHPGADRIYWLTATMGDAGYFMGTPEALGDALLDETTHTEHVALMSFGGTAVVQRGQVVLEELDVYSATSGFFSMFAFPLAEGHVETALDAPRTVVLAQRTADKYFPGESAVGQTLQISGEDWRVTGVAEPPAGNTYLNFSMLKSFGPSAGEETDAEAKSWNPGRGTLYVRLTPEATAADLEADLALLRDTYINPESSISLKAMSLADRYFEFRAQGTLQGNRQYLWVFTAIAVLMLLIACVNYMNLSTAQASRYAREVGVRKAVGAQRWQLAGRFLSESVLIVLAALLLAFGLAEVALPTFNLLMEKTLAIPYTTSVLFWVAMLTLALGTGMVAGSYPALYLSGLNPMRVLKGKPRESSAQGWFRKSLVVFQFSVTVVFVVSTLVVRQQLDFMQTRNLGLNPDQVLTMELYPGARENLSAVRQQVQRLPGVVEIAEGSPIRALGNPVIPEGASEGDMQTMAAMVVDEAFIPLLGIELVEGRMFDGQRATDVNDSVILNEAAVRQLGWHDGALGRTIERYNDEIELVTSTVVGVVKDFNFRSQRNAIEPLMLQMTERRQGNLLVKVQAEHTPDILAGLEALHFRFDPDQPFKYEFLDERFEAFYRAEERLGQIFGFFAGLAVFVACLGLFGLAAFLAEQRTKEIGIRKVLGASASGLLMLLTRDFVKLVLVAVLVATPLAHIAMTQWLSDFAYRIDLGLGVFATAGVLAVGIALVTVSYQAWKVTRANPIEALRYE